MCIGLPIYVFACLSLCLFICLSVCLSVSLFACLSVCLLPYLPASLSAWTPTYMPTSSLSYEHAHPMHCSQLHTYHATSYSQVTTSLCSCPRPYVPELYFNFSCSGFTRNRLGSHVLAIHICMYEWHWEPPVGGPISTVIAPRGTISSSLMLRIVLLLI